MLRRKVKRKKSSSALIPADHVQQQILLIRGQRVITDYDLARLYGVTTKRLNEAVKRNQQRFPADFAFQLTREELVNLRSQIATSSSHGGRRYLPYAFTEYGAIMTANVLDTDQAIRMGVFVVRAFVKLTEALAQNKALAEKLLELERKLEGHDDAIRDLFETLRRLLAPSPEPPRKQIGFHVRERAAKYQVKPQREQQ